MDKYENAVEQLKSGIKTYIDKKTIEIPCDRTFTALVTKINQNGTYEILLNGVKYNNIKTIGGTCYVNETVKVLVPQNNYNNMFILKAIEDVGNYKLFDYTNDKGIVLTEGELSVCKEYNWIVNGNKCSFIIDNQYYVTDDELYVTNGMDIRGSFFVEHTDTLYSYYRGDYVHIYTTGLYKWVERPRYCAIVSNETDRDTKIKYQYLSFYNGCKVWTIDNDKRHLSIEGNTNRFPTSRYRANWGNTEWSTHWGADNYTKKCFGYVTTNIPIFENSNDANEYVNGNKEILKKAINYKNTDYKEIFTTSVLMNENSKLKVDVEMLMNYNSDEYYDYSKDTTKKNFLKLPYGKNYGYSGFDCYPALREVFNRCFYSQILDSKEDISGTWGFFFNEIKYFKPSSDKEKEICLSGILAKINKIIITGRSNLKNIIRFYIDWGIEVEIFNNYTLQPKTMEGSWYSLYNNIGNYYDFRYNGTINDEYIQLDLDFTESDMESKRRLKELDFADNSMSFDGMWIKNANLYKDFGNTYSVNGKDYKNGNRTYIAKDIPIYHYPLWFYGHSPIYIKNQNDNKIAGRFYNADYGDFSLYTPKFDFIKNFSENLKIKYKIDGELITDRQPKVQISEDGNVIRLMYVLSSEKSGMKTFSIEAGISKGIGIINEKNLLVTISGAGLIDQTYFSGDIEIEEEFSPITPINPTVVEYQEDVDVVIVERPTMRDYTWGELITNRITWQKAKDEYIW